MSKRRLLLIVSGVVVVGLSMSVVVGTASAATTCQSGLSNTTVQGPLIVPGSATCTLFHVTVNGPVIVQAGATLHSSTSTVNGSLTGQGATVQVCGGHITGHVSITRTPAFDTQGGSYLSGHPFPGFCDELTIDGSVSVTNNDPHALEVVGVVIKGSLTVTSNRGEIGPLIVASNTVGKSASVNNNSITGPFASQIFVVFNTVTGPLTCQNNDSLLFFGISNSASVFTGQCSA
jgi:hypothetical protein